MRLSVLLAALIAPLAHAVDNDLPVDSSTLRAKTLCGYQGWFRCPGDAANLGWVHWSNNSARIAPETLTFEMWPDLAESSKEERYAVQGFTYPDGTTAELYSAENARTVLRHFEWMKQYGIDGVWLQHFLVDLPEGPNAARYPSRMRVLDNVRKAAVGTGRVWALAFDMAAMPTELVYESVTAEWKRLVDAGTTGDARYVHEAGRPVVMLWGFYRNQNITSALANRLIDYFKTGSKYGAFLVGGCEWEWRTNPDPEWGKFLRRFDAICPWNVGNYSIDPSGAKWASTHYWEEDLAEARRAGMLYIPVFYPGFSWDNLKRLPAGASQIPRRGGAFIWKQFCAAAELELTTGYIAMFDEVDEGTAIFKVSNTPPTQAHFVTYEGLPADWYLHLAGEGTRMIRGERAIDDRLPAR